MKKFLVLYNAPIESFAAFKDVSEEDKQKEMEEWTTWFEANGQHFAEMGTAVGANTRITKDGTEEVKNEVGGFSVIQAESKEAAIEIMKTNPHFVMPGAYIEVMDWIDM